jgi:hypothetical protein
VVLGFPFSTGDWGEMKIGLVILLALAAVFACVWLVKLLNVKDFDKSIREEKKKFFPPPLNPAKSAEGKSSGKGDAEAQKGRPSKAVPKNREIP